MKSLIVWSWILGKEKQRKGFWLYKFLQGAHPFYKPKKGDLIHSKDSYCVEVQKPQGTECETCHQCDYEIEYADSSSSVGVLVKDKFHLMISNGSLVKPNLVFGYNFSLSFQLPSILCFYLTVNFVLCFPAVHMISKAYFWNRSLRQMESLDLAGGKSAYLPNWQPTATLKM